MLPLGIRVVGVESRFIEPNPKQLIDRHRFVGTAVVPIFVGGAACVCLVHLFGSFWCVRRVWIERGGRSERKISTNESRNRNEFINYKDTCQHPHAHLALDE